MQIPATSSATAEPLPASTRVPIQVLSQQDFLKLLAAQMTSQDPLNPQTDNQFIAQMAQFSSLEQSRTMQEDVARLQAYGLLGKTVEVQVTPEMSLAGSVAAVEIESGRPKLVVEGQSFDLEQVVSVRTVLQEPSIQTP
jgi:flagellar basal-body rod modification protein FlgD